MFSTPEILDQTLLEMRWRCLSLAADLDRLERAGVKDERVEGIRKALEVVLDGRPGRAERVQMLLSDG